MYVDIDKKFFKKLDLFLHVLDQFLHLLDQFLHIWDQFLHLLDLKKVDRSELKILSYISHIFINLKINLNFCLYPGKCIKFNQSECLLENPNSQSDCREIKNSACAINERTIIGCNPAGISKRLTIN